MYRFLDRHVADLDPSHRFLLTAMRLWTNVAANPEAVARTFSAAGATETLCDFGIAMTTLERDSSWMLRLAPAGHGRVQEDEARLLALFDAGLAGRPVDVRRLAASLVSDDAAPRLATAVELIALRITDGVFVERGR